MRLSTTHPGVEEIGNTPNIGLHGKTHSLPRSSTGFGKPPAERTRNDQPEHTLLCSLSRLMDVPVDLAYWRLGERLMLAHRWVLQTEGKEKEKKEKTREGDPEGQTLESQQSGFP